MHKNPILSKKERAPKPRGRSGDLTGRKHWKLSVVCVAKATEDTWNIKCECGTYLVMPRVKFFTSRSCGCHCKSKWFADREFVKGRPKFLSHMQLTKEQEDCYKTWCGMWVRCSDKNDYLFPDYGGRGIRVCKRWTSFFAFFKDMGPLPSKDYSIERLDVNKGYEPSNCIWLLKILQARNKRNTIRVVFEGEVIALLNLIDMYPKLTRRDFEDFDLKTIPDVTERVSTILEAYETLDRLTLRYKE